MNPLLEGGQVDLIFIIQKLIYRSSQQIDADEPLHYAAAQLGVLCLPVYHYCDAKYEWVKLLASNSIPFPDCKSLSIFV